MALLFDNASQIDPAWLNGKNKVGVTAGASAPAVLVEEVVARLRELGANRVAEMAGKHEGMVFTVPKSLLAAP